MIKRSKMDILSTHSLRNGLNLLLIRLRNCYVGIREWFKTAFLYYGNASFMKADLSLLAMYLFNSPYHISKRFLENKKVSNIYAYGETPISTLEKIVKECAITQKDHIFELGSGRGRVCFWLGTVLQAEVTGIDTIHEFIERATRIQERLHLNNIHFIQGNMLTVPLKGGSVFYLFGSTLDDDFLVQLTKRFASLKKGTRFITISFPLEDYAQGEVFEILKRFPVTFPWGETDAYLQVKK